jgi:Ca-activated chloride channel homolog
MNWIQQFHLIRPEWLLAILPLALLSWILLRKKLFSHSWQSVIDPNLLPHLLIGKPGKASRAPVFLFFICGLIAILALAGPAWDKLPQPVFKEQSALIILLDLSRSMDSADIKPSRLTRARHKISDILSQRKEGQTALIGYAAEAFTISPLTDDTETINAMVPSLDTDIMPAQGSRTDLALNKAAELFKNAGIAKGDIFLISDGVSTKSESIFKKQHTAGHRISILGIGTAEGGPITLADGGFLKDDNGSIVIPKLNRSHLRHLANQSGGRFSSLTADDADIKYLLGLLNINRLKSDSLKTEMKADVWREEGPWLLLLLIPFAAFVFRKGYLSLLIFLILPLPQSAEALSWDDLWLNDNQRAAVKFEKKQNSDAASLFNDPDWKASAHYKAGEYEQALEQLEQLDHSEAHYNRGNTLAKMGRTDEAIEAYKKALKTQPDHKDALHNKEQLEKQKQQQDQNKDQQKNGDDKQQSDEQNKNDSSEQNKDSDSQDNKQSKNNQDTQQQNQQQDDSQQKQSEQNNDKQKQEDQQDSKQAQKNQEQEAESGEQQEKEQALSQADKEDELSKQATEQWLRRVPDNPGGLLRNKFNYLYKQQQQKNKESQTW